MRKLTLLIIAVSVTFLLHAQDSTSFTFSFNHLAICVKDLDKTVDFYKKVLGLKEITNRTQKEGIRWLSLGGGIELHLISTIKEPFHTNKAIHLCLASTGFDNFIKRLQMYHIPYSDWPGTPNTITIRADGVKQVYFQDPDGYWIEVNNTAQ